MSFEKALKIPADRIGVLVGKGGKVKKEIEDQCGVSITVDSESGEVLIKSRGDFLDAIPFKAVDIVLAIARGFSPQRASRLLDEKMVLNVTDLKDYAGRSDNALKRIKGRIIGLGGKSRRVVEELTGANISVYGRFVAIIGDVSQVKLASEAVQMLATRSIHKNVFDMLQRARAKAKLERLKLWEGGEAAG